MQGATLPRCCKLEISMLLRFTSLGLGGWDFELVGGLLVLIVLVRRFIIINGSSSKWFGAKRWGLNLAFALVKLQLHSYLIVLWLCCNLAPDSTKKDSGAQIFSWQFFLLFFFLNSIVGTQEFFAFGFSFGFFGLIVLACLWFEFFCLTLERCLPSFYLIRDEPME